MRVLSALYLLYFILVFLVLMILFYPAFKWSMANPKKHFFAHRLSRFVVRTLLVSTGIRIICKGKEYLPQTPSVITPNHVSYLDILAVYALCKDPIVFIGKKELERWPFVRLFFKGKHILVDRGARSRKNQDALDRAYSKLKEGFHVVIFPEGGIHDLAPKLKPFKSGAFKLAHRAGSPIVPLVFKNSWKLFNMEKGQFVMRPGWAKAEVLPAIDSQQYGPDNLLNLRTDVWARMNEKLTHTT